MKLPEFVQIEPVGQCNLRCRMCPVAWRDEQPAAFMAYETFCRLVDQFPGMRELHLQGLGEPMLHPRFFDMVRYAAARGAEVSTNTRTSTACARSRCSTSRTTSASRACRSSTGRCAASSTNRRCSAKTRSACSAASTRPRAVARRLGIELRLPRGRPQEPTQGRRCHWPWRGAYVAYSGEAMPCCMVATPDRANFGSMASEGVVRIWNGGAYGRFRERLDSDHPPEGCRGCAVYQGTF